MAGNAKKFEFIMQVVNPEKSPYSSLITLANRKRKQKIFMGKETIKKITANIRI